MRPVPFVVLLVLLALAATPASGHADGIVSVCDEAHLLAALAGGGTVTFSCSGTITLTNTITISQDTTIDGSGQTVTISGGGAARVFMVNSRAALNLIHLTVADGKATGGWGGGVDNEGTLTVSNSTFSGNSADFGGGGIFNFDGTASVSNSTFYSNDAHDGGGISNFDGTVSVSNSTFSGNSANWGGGITNGRGTLTVSRSTFSGNSATGTGGGIHNDYGALTTSNSTFFANSATNSGGGIENYSGTLTLSNSTFSANNATSGGGIGNNIGTATLGNTIVAIGMIGNNCSGDIVNAGGNLSYGDGTCPGMNADPQLGPLQDNGGPTQSMALGPGSAALDAADDAICAAAPVNNLDQRGVSRPQGAHCDIGAYEATPLRTFLPMIMR